VKGKFFIILVVLLGLGFVVALPAWSDDGFYVISSRTGGTILKYQLFSSNTVDTTLPQLTWTKLVTSPMWTYNKVSATSKLFISYQDTIMVDGFGGILSYQVRVNDLPSDAGEGGAAITAQVPGGINSFSTTGVWSGVPQGDAVISNWQRRAGNVTSCSRNVSPFTTTIIVMEVDR
jgi:hypothetical protein